MARKYKKGDVVHAYSLRKAGEEVAVDHKVTVLGYWNGNVILEDSGDAQDLRCYSEGEVVEVYGDGLVKKSIRVQRLVQDKATSAPTWRDTDYATLKEAREANPGEYPSFFRRKLDLSGGPNWARRHDQPNN